MGENFLMRVDELIEEVQEFADRIFDHPEKAFHEKYAVTTITQWLEKHCWNIDYKVGNLETAFRAVWQNGEGGPSIGLLAEYDALPMGHACGHHMQGPIMLAVAQALREMIRVPCRIVYYGTPAEEGGQGKRIMLENGCFRDIDLALMTHAAPNTTVDIKSLAGVGFKVIFHGVAAHASLAPEKLRSALDAMMLTFQGVHFLHSHAREDVKFYCSVNECQGTPNNIDSTIASANISLRTYESADIPELSARLEAVVKGAAMMTGTTAEIFKISDIVGKLPSMTINQVLMKHAEELDAPHRLPYRTRTGSTDFAYVTNFVPGAVLRFAFVPEGTSSHSLAFLEAGKSKAAHDGMKMSARILALTAKDFIENSVLLKSAQEEFAQRKAGCCSCGQS